MFNLTHACYNTHRKRNIDKLKEEQEMIEIAAVEKEIEFLLHV